MIQTFRRVVSGCRFAALCVLFGLLAAAETPAYGYTDPGSGALLWQMLMAGLVGVAFYFRRLTNWVKSRKKDTTNHDA
jgi:hypothetical protein